MGVALRIDVGGPSAEQTVELFQLSAELIANLLCVAEIELTLIFSPNVPMQADGKRRVIAAYGHGLVRGSPGHHKACAGDDAMGMAVQNAPIHAPAGPGLIRIDNQILCTMHVVPPFRRPAAPSI